MENQGSLNLDAVNLTYTWNFSGFNLPDHTTGKRIMSEFKVSLHNTTQWRIDMYPKGVDDNSKNNVSLFIYLIDSKQFPIEATFLFSILNPERKKCNRVTFKKIFEGKDEGAGTYQFTSTSNFDKNYVINGKFTIICEISINLPQVQTANTNNLSVVEACINNLSDDFKKLIGNGESSDVSFNVSGQVFKAHKCILSTRSSVFAALFKHDMKESQKNSVDIEETEADVFKEMLRFMYTAKVENLDKLAFELLSLSGRYGLLDLKQLCALHLHDNLAVDNAIDIYLLSNRHNNKKLKTEVFNFIISNIKSIIDTPKFKTLENTNPTLVAEILRTLVTKNIT